MMSRGIVSRKIDEWSKQSQKKMKKLIFFFFILIAE